jgi:hypothetical protein
MMADVQFTDHGSIWLAQPLTPAAQDWIAEHIPDDALWHGHALVIEARYLGHIVQGMAAAGLRIEEGLTP